MLDYKKIIASKSLRLSLLRLLNFIPDQIMIHLQYMVKTGRILNLSNPVRYTEKIQWYKLKYKNPLMTVCSDKYSVRDYIEEKGFGYLLNDIYAVYETVEDIDFDALPNAFIIKHTTGSGRNIIVFDKASEDLLEIKSTIESWLVNKPTNYGREWGYENIKSRVIVEALLPRNKDNDLPDYKFFCFNGKAEYLYTMVDYVDDHDAGRCSFFDTDFVKLPYSRSEYKPIDRDIEKPQCFNEMVELANVLSKDFPHVRVDFYDINGRVVFGELTFYNASGYTRFNPDEFDFIMGSKFLLPTNKTDSNVI
ncbi:ATP-grasp fold amidoligase family protein [Vibrio splendidus]|uniref:ATP-grasp fold amidoligase family protein n=1 Tax=Vibrio splendidus TaxID=29497 RepID=UPI00352E4738